MLIGVFWLCALFVFYTYIGYPALLWLRTRLQVEAANGPSEYRFEPVTVVIAAHNERHNLPRKLASLRAQDYPAELIQVLVVSDGSDDGTCAVLQGEPGVRCLDVGARQGKANALNFAMAQVNTPWVVLTDARQTLSPNALSALSQQLQQPGVGVVSGELVIRDEQSSEQQNIGLYWRYEKWIRAMESQIGSTIGATGALYMMRAQDYRPIADDTVLDDVQIPVQALRRGLETKFCPRAQAYDRPQHGLSNEHSRKLRTLAGNYQLFARNLWLFGPGNPALWQFLSHKVFRLLVPYALLLLWLSSFILAFGSLWYLLLWGLQSAFYLAAGLAHAQRHWRRNKLCSFALVFVGLNLAAMQAFWFYTRGGLKVTWQRNG